MDPYKVLGISPNATDEEVKQAYRKLAKKYHPDRYQNSPLAETASEKMKEINAAYDQIMKQRKEGYSGSSSYTSYSGNTYSGVDHSGSGGERMNHVRMLLNQGRFEEAEHLLDQVMPTDRTAEWYYLMGVVSYRKGWLEEAFNYVQTACRLDPGNTEYQSFYNSILNARAGQTIHYRGGNSGCCTCDDACSICSCLLCLNSCCNICGR